VEVEAKTGAGEPPPKHVFYFAQPEVVLRVATKLFGTAADSQIRRLSRIDLGCRCLSVLLRVATRDEVFYLRHPSW